jgi:hypothetical protein
MADLYTTVDNEKLADVLQATGIPFTQTPADVWARAHGYEVEPGDENRPVLEHTGGQLRSILPWNA